jgi:hypothetical protein
MRGVGIIGTGRYGSRYADHILICMISMSLKSEPFTGRLKRERQQKYIARRETIAEQYYSIAFTGWK